PVGSGRFSDQPPPQRPRIPRGNEAHASPGHSNLEVRAAPPLRSPGTPPPDGRILMAASSRTGMASDLGLLVARILLGAICAAHGSQQPVTFGLAGATESFRGMGVPAPAIAAPVVAIVELVGGIALIA